MPAKKPTADDRLPGRFNWASYKFGALMACDQIDDKTVSRLFKTINAVDAIQSAQSKLHYSATGSENDALEKRLEQPLRQLRQTFVRQMDAAMRKVDMTQLPARVRNRLKQCL
jgi:hypothetical protein